MLEFSFYVSLPYSSLEEVLPALPEKPHGTWKKDKRQKEDGFVYRKKGELQPFLDTMEKVLKSIAEHDPVAELSIVLHGDSGTKIDWESVAALASMDASIDICMK